MKENKKDNKGILIIIIVVLILLVISLIGYILWDNIYSKSNESQKENIITESQNVKNDSYIAYKLFNYIAFDSNISYSTEDYLTGLPVRYDFSKKSKLTVNDLSSDELYQTLTTYAESMGYINETGRIGENGYPSVYITKEDLEQSFNSFYENNYTKNMILKDNFNSIIYSFELNNDKYIGELEVMGFEDVSFLVLYDWEKNNDEFTLITKEVYFGAEGNLYDYTEDLISPKETPICKINEIGYHGDEFNTYKYTFKLEDGQYKFESVEFIEKK